MCNIYKNNLIILSQLEPNQSIYFKEDTNQLKIDNRYLTFLRSDTDEKTIVQIINTCFIIMINNYILNIAYHESNHIYKDSQNLSMSIEENIREIQNTKELLNNSLKGLHTYYENLQKNNYNYQEIEKLYTNLNELLKKIEIHRDSYIKKINKNNNTQTESSSWLYRLYEGTIKPKKVVKSEPEIENVKLNEEIELAETDDELDPLCENIKDTESYILGFLYIVTRKISNLVISIGSHIGFLFR